MRISINIVLFCFLMLSTNSFSSGFDGSLFGPDVDGTYIRNGESYLIKSACVEVFDSIKVEGVPEHPCYPGIKSMYIGVPKIDATALEIDKLDDIVSSFDPSTFLLPWHNRTKTGYPTFIALPKGEITGGCVLLHGADNVGDIDFVIAKRLAEAGNFVVIPFLFSSHGISKVAQDQTAIPLEQSVVAAYRMLHFVKSHPDMADKKVSLIGRSRGAMVADLCARKFYQEHISPDLQFNQFIMIDGFILRNEEKPAYTSAPMLFMHGRLDTWTPLPFVERHVRVLKEAGYPVTLEIFEDGHHAFLEEATEKGSTLKEKEVQTFKNCTFIDRKEKGFTPLVFDADSNTLIESDALLGWDAFPTFLRDNMVASEKVLAGANGEYTELGLRMMEEFLGGTPSGK